MVKMIPEKRWQRFQHLIDQVSWLHLKRFDNKKSMGVYLLKAPDGDFAIVMPEWIPAGRENMSPNGRWHKAPYYPDAIYSLKDLNRIEEELYGKDAH